MRCSCRDVVQRYVATLGNSYIATWSSLLCVFWVSVRTFFWFLWHSVTRIRPPPPAVSRFKILKYPSDKHEGAFRVLNRLKCKVFHCSWHCFMNLVNILSITRCNSWFLHSKLELTIQKFYQKALLAQGAHFHAVGIRTGNLSLRDKRFEHWNHITVTYSCCVTLLSLPFRKLLLLWQSRGSSGYHQEKHGCLHLDVHGLVRLVFLAKRRSLLLWWLSHWQSIWNSAGSDYLRGLRHCRTGTLCDCHDAVFYAFS